MKTPDRSRRASSSSTNRASATRTVNAFWMSICEVGNDDVSVRELNDLRVTGVVDRDNHVSVACEVLGKTGVEAAFDAESR